VLYAVETNMKMNRAWWFVIGLLFLAWVPFLVGEVVHKIWGANGYSDQGVAIAFGFWLFVWSPCHIIAAVIVLFKVVQWIRAHRHSQAT
jgi:uncharacterized membrane protein